MISRIRKMIDDREAGFTLIELLVVIIIIGILAAIAIPVFLNQRKKGFNAGIKSDLGNAAIQEESVYTDNQAYAAGTALTGVKVSSGNVLQAGPTATSASGADAFCIKGSNPKSDAPGGTGAWYWYDSTLGGLQSAASATAPTGGACASATLTAVTPG